MKRRNFIKAGAIAGAGLMLPVWMSAGNRYLPNVLILGDSISIGYTTFVTELLKGDANVQRPLHPNGRAENCQGTLNGVKHIDRWLEGTQWDIIHFNFGLHDLKRVDGVTGKNSKKKEDPFQSDLDTYKKNLKHLVNKIKLTKAKLIFATTTPYPDYPDGPLREPGLAKKYNDEALRIMKNSDIMINDLYAFVKPRMGELMIPNNVHFTKMGSEILAREVVSHIKKHLNTLKS